MSASVTIAQSEFIVGGQKSGKSRRAEMLAQQWLSQDTANRALLIATGQAGDDEMHQRIARHRVDRALRVPGLETLEEPLALAAAVAAHSSPSTLVVVDCLTLWLTNLRMPVNLEPNKTPAPVDPAQVASFLVAIEQAAGPVVVVGNEIGMGVIPLGAEVRAFVDALGQLNQAVAARCARVTFMAAGLPLTLKGHS